MVGTSHQRSMEKKNRPQTKPIRNPLLGSIPSRACRNGTRATKAAGQKEISGKELYKRNEENPVSNQEVTFLLTDQDVAQRLKFGASSMGIVGIEYLSL